MRGGGRGTAAGGWRGALAWAGRQHLDACGLCSQLSNVPALPGDARPQPRPWRGPHIGSSGATPHPTTAPQKGPPLPRTKTYPHTLTPAFPWTKTTANETQAREGEG